MLTNTNTLIALIAAAIANIILIGYLSRKTNKNQLSRMFICTLALLSLWVVGLILQITLSNPLHIEPIYFDYFVYTK